MALKAPVLYLAVLLLTIQYCVSDTQEGGSSSIAINTAGSNNFSSTVDWVRQLGHQYGDWLKKLRDDKQGLASDAGSITNGGSSTNTESSTTSNTGSSSKKTDNENNRETKEEIEKVQAIENHIQTDDGITNTVLSYAISIVSTIQNVLSAINSSTKSIYSTITSITDTLGSSLSTPEQVILHLVGYVLSTVIQVMGSTLSYLPLVGEQLSSSSHRAAVCTTEATQKLTNTIPVAMIDCALSPITNIADTVVDVTAGLEKLIMISRGLTSEAYACGSIVCGAFKVASAVGTNQPLILSLIYNIVTGVISIGASLGGVMPCIMTSVPVAVIRNILNIITNFFGCLF